MAKKTFLADIDLALNQLLQSRLENLTTTAITALTPSAAMNGRVVYDTDLKLVKYCDGTNWQTLVISSDSRLTDSRTPTSHIIATNTGLGPQHTISGAAAGQVLRASSATAANFQKLDHADLNGIGTNTHAQIDAHIANTSNPHSTTKTQVGLGNVDNVQQIPMSYLDTDGTLTANSDTKVASQKAIKTYVESKLTGKIWKYKERAATTTNGALATTYANGQTIDGVALATGDRILIKNQTVGAENGIYTVNASGAPTRASDADTGSELINATVFVSEGSSNADTAWTCTNNTITLGTTAITFVQFSGAGTYVAGTGLSLSGNTFSVSNLTTSHFTAGVVGTSTSLGTSDTVLPTQNAVKVYVDGQVSTINTNINNRTKYYKGTISAATTGTITVATHGCGTLPQVQLYETISTVNYLVDADISVNASGDVTWTTSTSFTGFIVIIGK